MSKYSVIPAAGGTCLSFVISCGLQEGYREEGILHHQGEAEASILQSLEKAAELGGYIPSGTIVTGESLYAWPGGSGSEPAVVYVGETKPEFPASYEEVKTLLLELAAALGSVLGQSRVYVKLGDELIVLQQDNTVLPTD